MGNWRWCWGVGVSPETELAGPGWGREPWEGNGRACGRNWKLKARIVRVKRKGSGRLGPGAAGKAEMQLRAEAGVAGSEDAWGVPSGLSREGIRGPRWNWGPWGLQHGGVYLQCRKARRKVCSLGRVRMESGCQGRDCGFWGGVGGRGGW